ncbi:hypothetical protein EOM39_00065 [Candidatus Gracilibacteria bacterium]|nr:hypothetical protein [Candidatus Gracilibacteria bacterium]
MGKLTHEEKILLLVAQYSPIVKKWLLHVLVNNEKAGGFHGVFMDLGKIDDAPKKISVDLSKLNDIMNLNVGGKTNGNSFLTIGVN